MANQQEEHFEIFDSENKECLGQLPRSEVHRTGKLHRSVNVILINNQNEILLQLRAANKVVCPSKWDLSVCLNS